jgi:hypothetical protein
MLTGASGVGNPKSSFACSPNGLKFQRVVISSHRHGNKERAAAAYGSLSGRARFEVSDTV